MRWCHEHWLQRAAASPRPNAWAAEDETTLRRLQGQQSHSEIAALLGRTEAAVRNRCYELGLVDKSRVWTEAEVASLHLLYRTHAGGIVPLAAWAREHGRHKANISRKARQFGLTDADRPRKPPRKPKAKWATDAERRAAISRGTREYQAKHGHPRGALGMKHTEATKQLVSKISRRMWELMTPEQRAELAAKRNQTMLARYGTGNPGMLGKNPYSRCRSGKRADLDNRYFRSSWEANYARYLNFQQAQGLIQGWEYEPQTYVFHGITRGELTYTPDFRITELDGRQVYHEVKGWMTSSARTRLKRMAEYYPEVEVRLIDATVYRGIAAQCAGFLPHWE